MMLKKILTVTGKVLAAMVGLVLIFLLSEYCLSRMTVKKEANAPGEVVIYIKTNGVHTDIVVPVRNEQMDWSKEVRFANTASGDSNYHYLSMGWGDKGFYLETPTWSDLKFSVAFKAVSGLGSTAIHATFYPAMQESKDCRKITISKKQYALLTAFVAGSFKEGEDGHFIHIRTHANYGNTDAFYEARGSYSMFYTCNTWANTALKRCGQKCCVWTIFDTGIFQKYDQ